jgi:hypothetical protein
LIILAVTFFGALGGAIAWLILNTGYLVFWIPLIHRRLLLKEKMRWYLQDICLPLAVCILIAGLGRIAVQQPIMQSRMILYIFIVFVFTLGITALATPVTRAWLLNRYLHQPI